MSPSDQLQRATQYDSGTSARLGYWLGTVWQGILLRRQLRRHGELAEGVVVKVSHPCRNLRSHHCVR
jgi:hypothetical protein